jgi:hypothetical protein
MENKELVATEAVEEQEVTLRKRALQLKLEDSLTDTIHTTVETIKERIENGDYKVNLKSGEIFRVPVNMKDLASTLAIIYDKRALIRGEATSIKSESKATLQSLKANFEMFALQLKEKDVISEVPNANDKPNNS